MINRFIIAIVLIASPTFVYGQDLFLAFGQGADASLTTQTVQDDVGSGTAFLFSRVGYDFDAIQVNVASSDTSVLNITSGEIFNSGLFGGAVTRFNDPVSATSQADGSIVLFGASFANLGVDGANNSTFADEDYDPIADAFLIAQLEFDVVSAGTADLNVSLFGNGILLADGTEEDVLDSGSASLTVTPSIPEPTSAALLAFGMAGMLVRRKR